MARQYTERGPDEQMGMSPNLAGFIPNFSHSFRSLLEQVRADKRRAMEQMINMVQTEMALERILKE